jgi:NAD+ diphosphatase
MPFIPGVLAPADVTKRAWFLVHPKGLVLRADDALPDDADADALGIDVNAAHYLGRLDDAEAFAAPVETNERVPAPFIVAGPRTLFGKLGKATLGVAGRAIQIIDWATSHRFCGHCATPTLRISTERCLRCPACKLSAYPRIAPAMIVLVRRGDEALLASNAKFPAGFYSTLAGFVEVGESLEETVAREVREEVGVEVKDIRYFGSQPWPFPHSLMVGFLAEWAAGEIVADPSEISDARWFKADALPMLPPPISIARRMIDAWLTEIARR